MRTSQCLQTDKDADAMKTSELAGNKIQADEGRQDNPECEAKAGVEDVLGIQNKGEQKSEEVPKGNPGETFEAEQRSKSSYNPSEENIKKCHKEIESLLRRLHLQDQHPNMLSSEDFVKVGPPVKQTEIFEKDKVCMFFQRLLMLDYRARYIHIQQKNSNVKTLQIVSNSGSASTDENDLAALFKSNVDLNHSKENHVHPMDVQMAAFRCSDGFLKQKMITKLSQCQYALPLLIPDPVTTNIECPLWTFRQITKTWKIATTKDNKTTVTMKSMPIYKAEIPMVSFFRLGSIADNDSSAVQIKPYKYKLGLKERSQSDVSEELKEIIRAILSGPHSVFQIETLANDPRVKVDEDAEGHIEKEKGLKNLQLMRLRQEQCDLSNSELVKSFTESLRRLPPKEREYFLKWTQILIDALSTDDLSSILQDYDKTWSEVLELKRKHDKSANFDVKQAQLNKLSKKLQSATFGLEHIFREMGQIYEAHKSLKKSSLGQWTEWTKYPELAADLMIKGHPMELMDGDAGHVPLIWVSSLIQEVINKLGDQRVFVLSVLGVQSSGKSTMLNVMFGLQFAVSAGRCTKGVYMQLVKLSDEIQKDYKFDYILVVDTEGLRALELAGNATIHHDNELATFVVGLGNMTLINIFGENPAEMQDVLQIVVQAFMRMKKVKLSPSCVFVHQNVTDITATEKNMDGKRHLQEILDNMAKLAAKEEGCDVECFSDVIAFDVQKDVKYFAQLWEGSPPMAPPNPGYSESVQELKTIILSKAKPSDGILLSHLNTKIQDLWNALMNENFVFSFKNTQEIAVYRKLEVQYGNWTWTLRSEMLNIENQLYPKIEKGQLDKAELSYLSKEIKETYKAVTDSIGAYFDNDKDKEMLVQWKGRFENKIREFHEELLRGVKRKLDDVIRQNKARKKLDKKKTEFENKLFQKICNGIKPRCKTS
ncbi:PREDICTED: interferon-induced very large GTPase 1-like [Cyprinodon variegatus]|uniref:interferon-induced very large GTPase 1-like n=1 Tax=Cyprinodon variegatus TaxID=28743 RepID=UPI0007425E83|nr:PREDICTED: interferon-induced very large GTPase 1-like [Cyprinodon variegatus]